jgi:hypothetical protein
MGLDLSSLKLTKTPTEQRLASFKEHIRHDAGPVFQIEHNIQNRQLTTYVIKQIGGWFYYCISEARDPQHYVPSVCFGLQSDSSSPPTHILELVSYLYSTQTSRTIQLRDRGLISCESAFSGGFVPLGAAFQHLLTVRFSFDQIGDRFTWIKERHSVAKWIDPIMLIPVTLFEANAFQTGGCTRVMASLVAQRSFGGPLPYWLHSPTRPCSFASPGSPIHSVLKETTQVDLGYVKSTSD